MAFEIIENGGTVHHLPIDDYGGVDRMASRHNVLAELNENYVDIGRKFAHFAGVGSGLNFFTNAEQIDDVPSEYVQYAIEHYALYAQLFFDEDIGVRSDYAAAAYETLKKVSNWYDGTAPLA